MPTGVDAAETPEPGRTACHLRRGVQPGDTYGVTVTVVCGENAAPTER